MQDRLIELWRARPRLIVGAALGVVALTALGAFVINGGGDATPRTGGPGLDIAVVAPVEPDIQPGERMGVGALVNDFDGAVPKAADPADAPAGGDDGYHVEQPAYTGDERAPRGGRTPDARRADEGEKDWRTVEGRGDRMGLGFDGPRPESGAEREARTGPVKPRESSPRPSGDPGSTFY